MNNRLKHLSEIEDGWNEGSGSAPNHKGLDWLLNKLDKYFPEYLYVYPTYEGNVQIEWTNKSKLISLEIDLDKKTGFYQVSDIYHFDDEEEEDIDLTKDKNWILIVERIKNNG